MNREAVALGTPVWTTFEGRLGAVDERLIAEGRLRRLEHAEERRARKRAGGRDAPSARPPRPARARRALLCRRWARPSRGCPVQCRGCAAGSARRPSPSTGTRSRSSLLDAGLVALAYYLAYRLRFDGGDSRRATRTCFDATIAVVVVGSVVVFALFGLYQHWWRYVGAARLPADRAGRASWRRSRSSATSRSCSPS